ncbi:MAG TPA: CAP domain-containing protein [Allosphingosinicella sp.]|nr:CAP domain-containing protein [Allosphingosinicella sp.]
MVELINRFRMDPDGEFDRLLGADASADIITAMHFFGVLSAALRTQLGGLAEVAPLAWNSALADAAHGHNAAMIRADQQTHQAPGERTLGDRIKAAGYIYSTVGENVSAFSSNIFQGHGALVIDWGYDREDLSNGRLLSDWRARGDGMQDPAGHRKNLMSGNFTEIGIAATAEDNGATEVGPLVITQDLGNRFDYQPQFVGVVINDLDNDDFYDVGEGLGGVTITLEGERTTYTTTSWASGGWQIAVPAGTYTITFSGRGLGGTVTQTATLGRSNVKVDAEAADATGGVPTSGNDALQGTSGADRIAALGGNDVVRGLAGNDQLLGSAGDDRLYGEAGHDTLDGGSGANRLWGGSGDDIFVLRSSADAITEAAGEGTDTVRAYVGHTLGANVENGVAMVGGLTLNGNEADNGLTGSSGIDRLNGLAGTDSLIGNAGADTLRGGAGLDRLTGGTGADRFMFDDGEAGATAASADRILDFDRAEGDRLNLAGIDANSNTAADEGFTFIGGEAFHGTAGELRYVQTAGGVTLIQGDRDGDGAADLYIRVEELVRLVATDFVL